MDRRLLTDTFIRGRQPAKPKRRDEFFDTQVPGFALRVTDRGAKSYILYARFPPGKVPARRFLGDAERMTLADARAKAAKWVSLIANGQDPREVERLANHTALQRQKTTFAVVAEAWLTHVRRTGQRKAAVVAKDVEREFIPRWGNMPITEITQSQIRDMVVEVSDRAPAQARNLLGHAKLLFDWAVRQGYGLDRSPATSLKPRDLLSDRAARDRSLNDEELFAFWRAVTRMPYPVGHVYKLLVLTGLRRNEVAKASWREFSPIVVNALRRRTGAVDWSLFDPRVLTWEIPKERMKGRPSTARAHLVPLTIEMLNILDELPLFKRGDYVFSTTLGVKPVFMGDKIKKKVDARMLRTLRALARRRGEDPATMRLKGWVNHDLRRVVRSGLAKLRIPEEAREAVLAHARPGITKVYDVHDYFDEKREALTEWAKKLRTIVAPPPTSVIKLHAQRGS